MLTNLDRGLKNLCGSKLVAIERQCCGSLPWLTFHKLALDTYLQAGLGRKMISPKRYTDLERNISYFLSTLFKVHSLRSDSGVGSGRGARGGLKHTQLKRTLEDDSYTVLLLTSNQQTSN